MATKTTKQGEKKTELSPGSAQGLFPTGLSSFNDIERMFDDYFNRGWFRSMRPGFPGMSDLWGTYEMRQPSMDVIDREKDILIRAELPGVDKQDLDISVSDNILTIKGESKFESKKEKDEYYSSEIKQGSFARSVMLPNNVDSTKISAELKNGLLEVTVPKTGSTKRKTIKVS